jgi:hypothetical protein
VGGGRYGGVKVNGEVEGFFSGSEGNHRITQGKGKKRANVK